MCAVDDPCSAGLTCVSGRCVSPKNTVRLFEVDDAGSPLVKRRVVVPSDLAWLSGRESNGAEGSVPRVASFDGTSRGTLLLQFADLEIPNDLVEAYVVLRRAPDTDPPEAPVVLRALRVEDIWSSPTLSSVRPPRLADIHGPETRVVGAASDVVRIDVKALLSSFGKKKSHDRGIAIVLGNEPASPLYLALAPSRTVPEGPVLEIYAR
jgi:hypothetical protein